MARKQAAELKASREEIAWLAGILEGEACFTAVSYGNVKQGRKKYVYPQVQLVMTDGDIVRRVATLMGATARGPFQRGRYRQHWRVNVSGWPAVDIMKAIRPWMGERRSAVIDDRIREYEGRAVRRDGRRTHCKHGHDMVGDNVYVNPKTGQRHCQACRLAWQRKANGVEARMCAECGKPIPLIEGMKVRYCGMACRAKRKARYDATRYRPPKSARLAA